MGKLGGEGNIREAQEVVEIAEHGHTAQGEEVLAPAPRDTEAVPHGE